MHGTNPYLNKYYQVKLDNSKEGSYPTSLMNFGLFGPPLEIA